MKLNIQQSKIQYVVYLTDLMICYNPEIIVYNDLRVDHVSWNRSFSVQRGHVSMSIVVGVEV